MTTTSLQRRFEEIASAKNTPFVAGIILMALFALAVVFGLNAVHGMPLADRKTVKVSFADVSGLSTGDDVRVASVRVGYVEDILLEDGDAVVVLKLDDRTITLHEDASATSASVLSRSALGQKYVNLDPGSASAPPLEPGATIRAQDTEQARDINQLLNVLDKETREATSTALTELGAGAAGHSDDVADALKSAPGMLSDLDVITKTLSARDGDSFVGMLESANSLAGRFAGRQKVLAEMVHNLGETLSALGVDASEPLERTLADAPETLSATKQALDSLRAPLSDTAEAMTKLRPGAKALGTATPDLRGVLREAVAPLKKAPAVSKVAEPAVEDLTGFVVDARPLAQQLIKTGDSAAQPLSVFEMYSKEIVNYFRLGTAGLSHGDKSGHWLRIMLLPGLESVIGIADSPTTQRNPYPAPGEAALDKSVANGGIR